MRGQGIKDMRNWTILRIITLVLASILIFQLCALGDESPAPIIAEFPLQFSANIQITSHLVAPDSDYPPQTRRMTVYYDYIAKKARADIEAGYEAAKIYIRVYGDKAEYMFRLPPISDCKRSYLNEEMPYPDISFAVFQKQEEVNSELCNYFLIHEDNVRIHIYISVALGAPVRLIEEEFENGVSTPLLTYNFDSVVLRAPPEKWFLPEEIDRKSKSTCDRHVGGFPYLHIFHYYVRF